ncbi:MAG: PilN domain-containing protein [Methylococcaceae bacterium]|jgi:type IV pilus assembly protein PilN
MIKINLLPWREELRKEKQQAFINSISIAIGLTVCILGAIHIYISNQQEYQAQRNKMLQDEITMLDQKIVNIKSVEVQKTRLINKITVIHNLQRSRPEIVHLFNEIPRVTPEGLFITKLTRTGRDLVFEGKAQSNSLVSAFMSTIANSQWLQTPSLDVITQDKLATDKSSSGKMNDFTLRTKQRDLPDVK